MERTHAQRRPIGATGISVTALGLGTAPIGNLFAEVTEADASATLATAARHGVAWFDTAPFYGLGLAEQRLGRFLASEAGRTVTVSTKVGRRLEPADEGAPPAHFVNAPPFQPVFDYSADGIRRSLEDSLGRIGRDRVELVLLHDVDRTTHGGAHRHLIRQLITEAIPELNRLKAEGLVGAIGLGINEWEVGYELLLAVDLDAVLLAGRYTLLDQSAFASGFLDACARRRVSVLAGGIFNSGLLAGGDTYDYATAPPAIRERTEALKAICREYDVALPAAALQFSAAHPAMTSVVVGARSAKEVDEIVGWWSAPLPAELWDALKARGALLPDAPTPGGR